MMRLPMVYHSSRVFQQRSSTFGTSRFQAKEKGSERVAKAANSGLAMHHDSWHHQFFRCFGWERNRGQVLRLKIVEHLPSYSIILINSIIFDHILSYSIIFNHIQSYSIIFHYIPSYSVIHHPRTSSQVGLQEVGVYCVLDKPIHEKTSLGPCAASRGFWPPRGGGKWR